MYKKPIYYNSLNEVYLKIWKLLKLGSENRNSSFHLPTFICGQNNRFDGRLVVLRGIDKIKKKIWFHTDIRSNKIKILKSNPGAALLFYDKVEKIQLRISVLTKINYQNNIAEKSWKKTAHMSRQCYLGEKAPGLYANIPTSGLSENIDNSKYTIQESEYGYKNFCVIENFINTIEWLYLAAKGHRRAYFQLQSNGYVKMSWLIP